MNDSNRTKPSWVLIARVLRARGNKGEVAAELFTDFTARLASLSTLYISKANPNESAKEPREIQLRKFWVDQNHVGQGIFHFAGCDTIDDAEKLRGCEILLPMEQRVELPAGQYFVTDLIGCAVLEEKQLLGTVRDVYFPGEGVAGAPLLDVKTEQGELLVPLADEICQRIDVVAKEIAVKLPEGLRELEGAE